MDLFTGLQAMEHSLAKRNWDALEASWQDTCIKLAGHDVAHRIAAVGLKEYRRQLSDALHEAIERAKVKMCRAVCYDYDLENYWRGSLLLYQVYSPQREKDERWRSDWIDEVDGPMVPPFGAVFAESGLHGTPRAVGASLYMIARTVATYGRVADHLKTRVSFENLAICVGYHDQDPVMRIIEPGAVSFWSFNLFKRG